MNYPIWVVPHIGGGWVIGVIAIVHVVISHFAVGGGLYLVLAERRAIKLGSEKWIDVLKWHSRFFLILTGVFGAVSGVGIWFAIGLVNPEATSALIHNFVFAWATEWAVFFVELTASAVYYYSWGRVSQKTHLAIGWIYAIASFLTLAIINGILSFMLTPGEAWLSVANTGKEASTFWHALFNPTYLPSLVVRTAICFNLAAIWAMVSYSGLPLLEKDKSLKEHVMRWSAGWIIPGALLMPVALVWYLWTIPTGHRNLLSLGVSTIGGGVFTQATRAALVALASSAGVVLLVYLLGFRMPKEIGTFHSAAVLLLAVVATAAGEYTRELLRKPFVIVNYMYSNGVRVTDVDRFNSEGYLSQARWVSPQGDNSSSRGEALFRGQCLACHTLQGYRSMKRLLSGRNLQAIRSFLDILNKHAADSPYRAFMPPLVGTKSEIDALAQYLASLVEVKGSESKSNEKE